MQSIRIRLESITKLKTEIIVNAANSELMMGGGVCGYIFRAAGADRLQKACNEIGYCETGSAVITPGFDLCRYIVHAVGPVWYGGKNNEPEALYSAYQSAMKLAKEHKCASIGFPLISAGIYGYPLNDAWKIAIRSISDFFKNNKECDIAVEFAVLDDDIYKRGCRTLDEIAKEYQCAVKSDWKTVEMPEKNECFELKKHLSKKDIDKLRRGHIPEAMEDKWFYYMEGNTLFAHRSWTGYCIYIAELNENGRHKVIVNRDSEQYTCTDIKEDQETLSTLLSMWIRYN